MKSPLLVTRCTVTALVTGTTRAWQEHPGPTFAADWPWQTSPLPPPRRLLVTVPGHINFTWQHPCPHLRDHSARLPLSPKPQTQCGRLAPVPGYTCPHLAHLGTPAPTYHCPSSTPAHSQTPGWCRLGPTGTVVGHVHVDEGFGEAHPPSPRLGRLPCPGCPPRRLWAEPRPPPSRRLLPAALSAFLRFKPSSGRVCRESGPSLCAGVEALLGRGGG